MLLQRDGLARNVAAHDPSCAMRAGLERIGVAQSPSDVRAGTHGTRDNAHDASIGVHRHPDTANNRTILPKFDAHLNEVVAGAKRTQVIGRETVRKLRPFLDHRGVGIVQIALPDSQDGVRYASPSATIPRLAIVGAADWNTSLDLHPDLWQVRQVRSLQTQWRCDHTAANIDADRCGNDDLTSENRTPDTSA